jgi:hypothetical protein
MKNASYRCPLVRTLALSLLVLAIVLIRQTLAEDVVSIWNGTVSNWASAGNWTNVPSVPFFPNNGNGGLTYDAIINNGIVTLDENIAIEDFSLAGGLLTGTTSTLSIGGSFHWGNGTVGGSALTGPGAWTVSGNATWGGGTLAGSGLLTIDPSALLTLNHPANGTKRLSRSVINNGAAFSIGHNTTELTGVTFTNNGTFTTAAETAGTFHTYHGISGSNVFNNNGTLTKLGDGVSQFRGPTTPSAVVFNNSNIVDVQAGNLRLLGGGTHTGDVIGSSDGIVWFGGDHLFLPGAQILGSVNVLFFGGNSVDNGTVNTTGNIAFQGAATMNAPVAAGSLTFTSGSTTFNSFVTAESITAQGGTAIFNSSVLVNSTHIIDGGVVNLAATLSGDTTIENGGQLNVNGSLNGNLSFGETALSQQATVSPGFSVGQLNVAGNYEQGAQGVLAIEIDGAGGAGGFDTISVTGTAQLGGVVEVDASEFTPLAGATDVPILTAGSILPGSRFSDVETAGNDDVYFAPTYDPGIVRLISYPRGDMNRNGQVNSEDIDWFALALTKPDAYFDANATGQGGPACLCVNGSQSGNMDGQPGLDFDDVDEFAAAAGVSMALVLESINGVPEPQSATLLALSVFAAGSVARRRDRSGKIRELGTRGNDLHETVAR